MKETIVVIVMLAASFFSSAFAEEFEILTVDEPPSSYIGKNGEPEGFAVDVVREIQRRINNSDPILVTPEARALKIASQKPNVVLFSFSRTPEREDKFHWIMLLLRKSWVLYAKSGSGIKLNNLEDARNVSSIGVLRGDIREDHLKQLGFNNLSVVKNHEHNVRMLQRGRVDLLYYEPIGMDYACKKLGISISEFEAVLETQSSEVYIMMSKNGTDAEAYKKWRDAANQIKKDGTFDRIAKKWEKEISNITGLVSEVKDGALNF